MTKGEACFTMDFFRCPYMWADFLHEELHFSTTLFDELSNVVQDRSGVFSFTVEEHSLKRSHYPMESRDNFKSDRFVFYLHCAI